MSNTITFDVSTNAQPGITVHDMKYALYKSTDLSTIVSFQTFTAPHGARTVSFPGLLRTNYRYRLLEMNGASIVAELDKFDFVPGENNVIYYQPVEIIVNITPGLTSGTTSFTFDGTAGTFDWRGRIISLFERVGQGTMQAGIQYTWNDVTGVFQLLQTGDTFAPGELFVASFNTVTNAISGVPPQALFTGTMIVAGTTVLTGADIGKKIIIKGASSAFDITLPDISGVLDSIPTYFESGVGAHKCVRIKTTGGQIIDWLKGSRTDLKIGVCESLALYKEISSSRWRTHDADGNFRTVGDFVSSYAAASQKFNCIECDGSSIAVNDYRRLYEDYVLLLDPSLVCNYADHGTGTNKYKFSFSSGGNFFLPDLRELYERNASGVLVPTTYQSNTMIDHQHEGTSYNGAANLFGRGLINRIVGAFFGSLTQKADMTSKAIDAAGNSLSAKYGSETKPETIVVRKFVLT